LAGLAFDYSYHSQYYYAKQEETAKNKKIGVWESNIEKPWDFRRNKRKKSWF
jgi:endonuclease YncB( thermonuclease family)